MASKYVSFFLHIPIRYIIYAVQLCFVVVSFPGLFKWSRNEANLCVHKYGIDVQALWPPSHN